MTATASPRARRTTPKACVKWTNELRFGLRILHDDFDLNAETRTATFNAVFRLHLVACGLPEGTTTAVIRIQWLERKKCGKGWRVACDPAASEDEARMRVDVKQRITDALAARACPTASSSPSRKPPRKPASRIRANPRTAADRNISAQSLIKAPKRSYATTAIESDPAQSLLTAPPTPAADSEESEIEGSPVLLRRFARRSKRWGQNVNVRGPYSPPHTPRRSNSTSHSSGDDDEYTPTATRTTFTKSSAVVVTPRTPNSAATRRSQQVSTPTTSTKAPRVPHQQRNGSTIMVSPERAATIVDIVEPVTQHKAQPPLPGLLFRCWEHDPLCGMNSEHGFWSRKYYKANVVPHIPPLSTHIDPTDVFNHMNREMEKTPFISTSSRLIWTIQLMLKDLKAGKRSRVSVIDTTRLDKRTVFHARAFHDSIRKTYAFTSGADRYRGTYEYIVWKHIPQSAIIYTFKAEDLENFAASNEAVGNALQLEMLRSRQSLSRTKIPTMRKAKVALSPQITAGIAQLCIFLGLRGHSAVDHLSHIVSDVVEGWALLVEHRSEAEWYSLAELFAHRLCNLSSQPVTFKEREQAKFAYLNGVAWGCGQVNATHKPELIAKKQKKAAAVGLGSPATIIAHALDAARSSILSFEEAQNRRLEGYHQQAMTIGTVSTRDYAEDAQMLDDVDVDVNDELGGAGLTTYAEMEEDEIMYEEEELV